MITIITHDDNFFVMFVKCSSKKHNYTEFVITRFYVLTVGFKKHILFIYINIYSMY